MPDLCTLTDVKNTLGITDTSFDVLLARLISSLSESFLNEIRRPDLTPAADYTEQLFRDEDFPRETLRRGNGWPNSECYYYGRRTQELWLRHYPINSITSVKVNGVDQTEVTDPTDLTQSGWWFDETLDPESRQKIYLLGTGAVFYLPWSSGPTAIVDYNAGYDEIPPSISEAVIQWVAFRRGQAQLQALNQGAGAFKIGDYEQTNAVSELTLAALAAEIPEAVQDVIEKYRKPMAF